MNEAQAKAQLQVILQSSDTAAVKQQNLITLLRQIDVAPPSGTAPTTIFYAGDFGKAADQFGQVRQESIKSFEVAERISAKGGSQFWSMNKTEASKFVYSSEFLGAAPKLGIADVDAFLGANFWDDASRRLAQSATGKVITITPFATDVSAFSRVELATLLANPNVTSVNGIGRTALAAESYVDAFGHVNNQSLSALWSNVEVGLFTAGGASQVDVKVNSSFFTEIGGPSTAIIDSNPGSFKQRSGSILNALDEARFSSLADTGQYIRGLKLAGKYLGPVGDLIQLGVVTADVISHLNAGDRDGAARAAANGLGSIAGGALAASTAATFAAPLLAGGPVGWVAYTIIVVGAGIAGSEAGQAATDRAYTLFTQTLPNYFAQTGVDPIRWIADEFGVYHSFITETLPNGLAYAAHFTRELLNGEIDVIKWFTGDSPTPEKADIIVTANRRTGQTSVSNLPTWLSSDPQVAQELGQALLDFARSGGTFQGGTVAGGTGSSGWAPPPTSLAQARAPTSAATAESKITPVLRRNEDGTVTVGSLRAQILGTDGQGGFRLRDTTTGSLVDLKVDTMNGVSTSRILFKRDFSGGLEVTTEYEADGKTVKNTALRLRDDPKLINFSDAANILGDVLGYRLAGGNRVTGAVYSASLKTIGQNLGEALDAVVFGSPADIGDNIEAAFSDIDKEFLTNIKSAGIGAVSSFLTAELVNAVGISGFAGEIANTAAGAVIGQISTNLFNLATQANPVASNGSALTAFSDVNPALLVTAVGSFLGNKLANEIHSWDTVGGQIGAAVGSAISVALDADYIIALASTGQIELIAFAVVAAVLDALLGNLIGGLIGSIFGGTPRSGADAVWDSNQQKFVVANVWSKKGGSKDAARSVASAVSDTFNSVLSATGGTLLNPEAVQAGNYGMRKKDFVYRPYSTHDSDAITQHFSGENGATQLIGYGVYQGLTDPDFQIAGGDVYVKRALYNTFAIGGLDPRNFDTSVLSGNIASAQQYESYLANSVVINAMVTAEPDTAFAVETLITLARAQELGLTKRAASDWFGGFSFLIDNANTTAADVNFGFDYDPASGQVSRLIDFGDYVMDDSIDIAGQTTLEGSASGEVIDLRGGKLANQTGFTVNGHQNDDIAVTGSDFTGLASSVSFAANLLRTQVTVAVSNDGIAEATESFTAGLSNAPAMRIVGGDAVATIVNGTAALPTLMVGDSYAWENDGYAVFRLSLSKAASQAVTVALALTGDSATAGTDFGSPIQVFNGSTWNTATSATFAAGATELFVRTAIMPDNVPNPAYVPGGTAPQYLNVEGNERFALSATASTGAAALANGATSVSGTGTIVDGAGTEPLVWIDDVILDEASGQAKFTIARSRTLTTATTVNFATADRRALDIQIAATVDGGDGNDTIYASDLGDNLFGGAGNDTLYGGRLDDWLLGGDGDDTLDAGSATGGTLGGDGNYLDGGAGNDVLRGREGSDWLEGGDGVDTLTGGAGDDILAGGAGAGDSEKGGTGNDQYVIRRGDGADILEEDQADAPTSNGAGGDAITQRMAAIEKWKVNSSQAGAIRPDWIGAAKGVTADTITGGDDALVFGQGIEIGDIKLQRSGTSTAPGADLIVIVMQTVNGVESDSGTRVTIKDWFVNPFKRIEWLKFVDGTEVRIGDITSFIIGGAGNDTLIGTSGNDFVFGGAGNDKLFLLAGDDIGNGGTGDDMVAGGSGKDLVIGGLGADELIGGKGDDMLSGDASADDLYGGDGADVLSGGRGDGDQVVGGAGDDTFKYSRGDGRDMYFDDFVASGWSTVWVNGTWGSGYTYNATTGEVTGPGGVFVRKNMGTAAEPDVQWLGRFDYDDASGTLKRFTPPVTGSMVANNGVDTLEFGLGINIQDVILRRSGNDLVLAIADDAADVVNTASVADTITIKDWYAGLTGEIEKFAFYQTGILNVTSGVTNLVAGTDNADGTSSTPLAGTTIADWMTGGGGDDVLAGGSGNDILAGNAGFDVLRGESGNDVLYGGTGNDQLDGGIGSDMLIGGSGFDLASYASATAAVRAYLSASTANTGDAIGDEYDSIEGLIGGSGNDRLGGNENENELTGEKGSDLLMGGAGDDTYVWNTGDGSDQIHEGVLAIDEVVTTAGALASGYTVASWVSTGIATTGGVYWRLQIKSASGEIVYDYDKFVKTGTAPAVPTPDTYNLAGWKNGFARTNGQQVTRERIDATTDAGTDTIEFGAGISLSDLQFVKNGNDLNIRIGSSAENLQLIDHYLAGGRIEWLQLADGLAVSLASVIRSFGPGQYSGTAGDDLIEGQIEGALPDNLAGGDGSDVLIGFGGDDLLYGGNGDDLLEGGAGADRLDGGADTAIGSAATAGDTVRYVSSSTAVTVNLTLTTAQAGGDAAGDILVGIENVVGSRLGDTLTGDGGGNRLAGLEGNDTIRGGAGDDALLGDLGDDLLYGDAGADALSGSDGNDQLWGGGDDDRLDGGDGVDKLYGEAGNDTLTAGAGNDVLDGGTGDDVLIGDLGDDALTGGDGNDTLSGDAGNDSLAGGLGNDTYLFGAATGTDTIVDASGTNLIGFDEAVTFDRLWLVRSGNDLRIGVIGGSTTITVTGFYAATGPSLVRAIQTTTHAFYLDNADSRNLVTAMTAASTATPAALPQTIADQLAYYWHAGGKAAPTAPATTRTVTTAEDVATAIAGGYAVIDHDGGPITYSVKPDALPTLGAITGLNAATGALTYTPTLNANGVDTFSLLATDADGQSVELKVAVTITPVNDAPGVITVVGAPLGVAESTVGSLTTIGTIVGQLDSIDPDGDLVTFSLVDDALGRFQISADGKITVKATGSLDYEKGTSHVVTVKASDGKGGMTQQNFTVAIANVNEPNNIPATYAFGVNENVVAGTTVGTVKATDVDTSGASSQQRYYFLNGSTASATSADGRYAIDAVSGVIKSAASLDFEAANPIQVYKVVARDNAGASPYNQAASDVTIAIANVNEANAIPATYAFAVNENVPVGTSVGTVKATDLDAASDPSGQQRYYFLNGSTASATSSDGRYTIDAVSGAIKTYAPLNYEGGTPSVAYTVIARDNAGNAGFNQVSSTVTIGITDLNEPNALPASYGLSVNENVATGTLVGTVAATDQDTSGPFNQQRYYFLNGSTAGATSSDGRYMIDATTGQIKTASPLNFEAGTTSVAYTVIARDNAGTTPYLQASTSVTIGILDVNEAPTAMSWSPATISVAERDRVAPGTTLPAIALATFSVTDPDTAASPFATYTYAVSDSRFEFVGNSLRLKLGAVLDFEAGATVSVNVTATDTSAAPLTITRAVTVNVTNVDDRLDGDDNANSLTGQKNRDLIYGRGGDDTIDGGAGDDLLDGGTGNDRLIGGTGNNTLYGGDGTDILLGSTGVDILYGGINDTGTFDKLYGAAGNDQLFGEDGDDYLIGGDGGDVLNGGNGVDWADYSVLTEGVAATAAVTVDLTTPANNTGTAAGDTFVSLENIYGTTFADILRGDAGANVLRGDAGADTLEGRDGDDDIGGGTGNDSLDGGNGADVLYGDDGDDTIHGGAGDDRLYGGNGNDTLYAESGDDLLDGGAGNDALYGGTENDTYLITRSSGADSIYNYDSTGADIDVLGLQDTTGTINDADLWFEKSGNDLIVSVVATTTSARIVDWYTTAPVSGANYKIDFIVAGTRYSKSIDVESLVTLMTTKTKPTTVAARDAIMADLTYKAKWATYWGTNAAPTVAAIANQTLAEDGTLVLTVNATDDITPNNGIAMSAQIVSGTVVPLGNISFGAPDASGNRSMTIKPGTNLAGTTVLRVRATDAGGVTAFRDFQLTVNPLADKPTIASFVGGSGTSGTPVPLTISVDFPDKDGSEVQELWITGIPSGVTLSAGTYDSATATWKLTVAQAAGLKVNAPAGWSTNLNLTLTARATEGGATQTTTATSTVALNAPPTAIALSGSIAENAANGTAVGAVTGTDPDGDTLIYTLLDNAGGRFALSSTGTLAVANGALLNYEAATSHAITVRATDPFGAYKDQVLTVRVDNVNEAPAMPTGGGGKFFDETGLGANPANVGVIVATLGLYDPDGTTPSLEFTNDASGWFSIAGNTVRFRAGFDFEWFRNAGYSLSDYNNDGRVDAFVAEIHIRATDGSLPSPETAIQVYITDVNEAPNAPAGPAVSYFDETGLGANPANAGVVVASYGLSDPDGTTPSLQLTGNPGGWFYQNGSTIRFNGGLDFNFEWARSAGYAVADRNGDGRLEAYLGDVVVKASDGTVTSAAETRTQIYISDVAEAPNAPAGGGWAFFDETGLGSNPASADKVVASFGMSDPDGTIPTLELVTNPGNWFYVAGNTVRFRPRLNFDYEAFRNGGYGINDWSGDGRLDAYIADVWVRANDGGQVSGNTLLQVFISDVNERPNPPVMQANNIFQETTGGESHSGRVQATFATSDPDGTVPELRITGGNGNNWFRASGNQILVNDGVNWTADWLRGNRGQFGMDGDFSSDVNSNGLREIRVAILQVQALDASGAWSDPFSYNVLIEDKNEAPVFNQGQYDWNIAETAGWYTYVGTVAGSDVDGAASELRYNFATWDRYYDSNLGRNVSRSADQRFVMDDNGNVWTNGTQAFNWEGGQHDFGYSVMIYDKAWGANTTYNYSTLNLHLYDVDEQHYLNSATINVAEGTPTGPFFAIGNQAVFQNMLSDPEGGRSIRFTFDDGSVDRGGWHIDSASRQLGTHINVSRGSDCRVTRAPGAALPV